MASVAAIFGLRDSVAYVASKHAVVGLTKSTATDFGHQNIRVNAVAPELIETPMLRGIKEAWNTEVTFAEQALARKGGLSRESNSNSKFGSEQLRQLYFLTRRYYPILDIYRSSYNHYTYSY